MPESFFGMYRAKVVDNKDPEKKGRVMVWIPDLMPEVPEEKGIWARPANNPVGGRNMEGEDGHFSGTCYIPPKGSWMWIFFENGNPNRPYYFGALDLENAPTLPENQLGSNYQNKWTIFKSHDGRCIVVSDDPDDARIEITGKKRLLKNPPSGDTDSVYTIDGNQTTILLDERDGKEKILVRTHTGDFIKLDIQNREIHLFVNSKVQIKNASDIIIQAGENLHLVAGDKLYIQGGNGIEVNSIRDLNIQSASTLNELAGGSVRIHGTSTSIQSGAGPASAAKTANPTGDRD